MKILIGALLAGFGVFFILNRKRLAEGSLKNQERMGGPLSDKAARRLEVYSRYMFVLLPSIMVLIGIGIAVGIIE